MSARRWLRAGTQAVKARAMQPRTRRAGIGSESASTAPISLSSELHAVCSRLIASVVYLSSPPCLTVYQQGGGCVRVRKQRSLYIRGLYQHCECPCRGVIVRGLGGWVATESARRARLDEATVPRRSVAPVLHSSMNGVDKIVHRCGGVVAIARAGPAGACECPPTCVYISLHHLFRR